MKKNRMLEQGAALFLSACCAVLLNSCGSGAVTATPPTDPSAGTPLAVSPPVADVFPDLPTTFTITGGRGGYTAFSSNNAALPISAVVTGATFTVIANAVAADTAVDITVRDAANTSASAKATIRPSSLINQVTFTPFGPTGTGCGTGICSGGDAQVVVKAALNGVILRARPIRFDVYQGNFQLVSPGTGALVNTLTVNSDDQGDAVVRITTPAGVPTQTATLQFTDVASGLVRRFNFNIVQQTSGVGILSTLPSGGATLKGAKGGAGQDGFCPVNTRVDFYVYGGTPPYTISSPQPQVAAPINSTVPASGGSFAVLVNGCGTVAMIVTDSKGLVVETAQIIAQQGDKGEVQTTTLTVVPTAVSVGCGQTASISVVGAGNFTTAIVTSGVDTTKFSVNPSFGPIPNIISFIRASGVSTEPPIITVNIVAGATVVPVTVTTPATCP